MGGNDGSDGKGCDKEAPWMPCRTPYIRLIWMKIIGMVATIMKATINIGRSGVWPGIGPYYSIAVVVNAYIFTVININVYVIVTVVTAIVYPLVIRAYVVGFVSRIVHISCIA